MGSWDLAAPNTNLKAVAFIVVQMKSLTVLCKGFRH